MGEKPIHRIIRVRATLEHQNVKHPFCVHNKQHSYIFTIASNNTYIDISQSSDLGRLRENEGHKVKGRGSM